MSCVLLLGETKSVAVLSGMYRLWFHTQDTHALRVRRECVRQPWSYSLEHNLGIERGKRAAAGAVV